MRNPPLEYQLMQILKFGLFAIIMLLIGCVIGYAARMMIGG